MFTVALIIAAWFALCAGLIALARGARLADEIELQQQDREDAAWCEAHAVNQPIPFELTDTGRTAA
ncbi:hypothetical protein [Nakamurella leprariae]|uniref:Uncharacterized protein n=1 Tax=Nakamurella leprariae TaxID=2803911 RepID=A0A938YG87_9ACTN|nr:hypothetical protein [Nakamurella leprariae]MBM9467255.1 hypothetical protein [Nakamurella leprariae]